MLFTVLWTSDLSMSWKKKEVSKIRQTQVGAPKTHQLSLWAWGPWLMASFQFYNAAVQSCWPWDFTAGYYGPTHQSEKVISVPNMSGAYLTYEEVGDQKLLNEMCQGKGDNLLETFKQSIPSCS